MWRREMDWLLCVSDYIVELIPSLQTFPDGSKLEVQSNSFVDFYGYLIFFGPAIILQGRIISKYSC